MARYGKWIGGGLGWALLGPLGGVLGFVVGSMFDNKDGQKRVFTGTTHGDFTMSLLVLVAALMKADQKVMKSELDYVKQYFNQNFGPAASREAMLYLRDLLNRYPDVLEKWYDFQDAQHQRRLRDWLAAHNIEPI